MNEALRLRAGAGLLAGTLLSATVLLLAACQPIVDPALLEAQQGDAAPAATAEAAEEPAAVEAAPTTSAAEEPSLDVGPAQATVNTRSLRVRQEPNDDSEQIRSVKKGATYDLLGISSDGNWLQIAIPEIDGGQGWVSTGFVILQGDITNIQIAEVTDAAAATPEPEAEATPTEQPEEEAVATTEPGPEGSPGTEATPTAQPEQEAEATPTAEPEEDTAATEIIQGVAKPEPGYALVVINGNDALRVRSAPTADEDNKVGNVRNGEAYKVLEISEDGKWVRIDVPALNLENGGWVSADFVILGE